MCLEQKIQQAAYKIWLQEGRPHGRQKEHWFRAEQSILQAEVGRLRTIFEQKQQKLNACVRQMDIRLLKCDRVLAEYSSAGAALSRIGAKLETLGFRSLCPPPSPPAAELSEFLHQRLTSSIRQEDDD